MMVQANLNTNREKMTVELDKEQHKAWPEGEFWAKLAMLIGVIVVEREGDIVRHM